MEYYSTKNKLNRASFEKAVRKGLPSDDGLFMPEIIAKLPDAFFKELPGMSLAEIGLRTLHPFVGGEIDDESLIALVEEAFSFETPLTKVTDDTYALELYHGPTLAFKDIGARFMARSLSYFNKQHSQEVTVLVATSGDTGSAVANGFLGVKNVNVVILYPKGKVSEFQEKQMTTLGENIHAIEVDGNFDDCQALVKKAFLDDKLTSEFGLTSANSINVARFLPQMIYYFYAVGQLRKAGKPIVFSVPSGNYGNLTAGLFAQRMGLEVNRFVASTNSNSIVPDFLASGLYETRQSVSTISNAMDVGAPSNFARMADLFHGHIEEFRSDLAGYYYTDDQTTDGLKELYSQYGYIADPHGAVGYLGLKAYREEHPQDDFTGIFLETAHPIKFKEVVEPTLGIKLDIPESLQEALKKDKKTTQCSTEYGDFKNEIRKILH